MFGREALQRADSQERFIVPDGPKADVGGLQPSEVQGVRAARGRFRAGASQMDMQEIDHARVTEVALDYPHHAGFFGAPLFRISIAPRADHRQGTQGANCYLAIGVETDTLP